MRTFGANIVASPIQVVDRALFLAAAHRDDQVNVAGPDGLTAMVALCRAGFDKVECARQATCPGADDASDVLLIVGPMNERELAETVRRTAPLLADGGRLVIQLGHAGDAAVVRTVLASLHIGVGAILIDNACGRLAAYTVRRDAALERTA